MPTQKQEKEQNTIGINATELRNIMSEYNPDMLCDSEEVYNYKLALDKLDKSDKIIFTLYAELQSERRVAELLGVSRSPIHKIIQRIKGQILGDLEKQE